MSNAFVVCMGIGTVFVGLICIIILCKIVSLFCNIGSKESSNNIATVPTPAPVAAVANRQEIIAAVTAACAEDMGTDVSAIRVISFKKL